MATTNAVHSVFGEKHLSDYLFNWSRDGTVAEWGPYPKSRGTILLYR